MKFWDLSNGGPAVGNRYDVGGDSFTHAFKVGRPSTAIVTSQRECLNLHGAKTGEGPIARPPKPTIYDRPRA